MTYIIPIDPMTNEPSTRFVVKNNEDGSTTWIPCVAENSDYQAYLASQTDQ